MTSEQLQWMRDHKLAPKLKYPVPLRKLVSLNLMEDMRNTIIKGHARCGGEGWLEDFDEGVMVRCDCVYKWNYEVGLLASNVPPKYYDLDLPTLDPGWIAENTVISLKMEKMINNFGWYESRGRGFHFVGSPGTGKTAVACGLAKALLTQGVTVYYTTLNGLINKCMRTWKKDDVEAEEDLQDLVAGVGLLILDEIDRLGNPENPTIQGLIDEYFGLRYNNKNPTIIISKEAALHSFEGNVTDRFYESVTPLKFKFGGSYREKLAKERKADEDARPED